MKQQSSTLRYPAPTDSASIVAQFSMTPTNAHSHTGGDSPQIQYKNLLAKPRVFSTVSTALGTTGAITFDPTLGNLFTITPTASTQIKPTSYPVGAIIVVKILTSGATPYTITFDTGFVANGTLTTVAATARYYTVMFVCDGTYWIELSRTVAMLPT